MLISIIIPIYNIAPYLRGCLDACLCQTYKDLEVICVDDGSTDESGDIADEYAALDSRFRVIHKKNGGLPSARKAGLDSARGEYVFHLDGDDDLPANAIESLVAVANTGSPDLVIGDYFAFDSMGTRSLWDSRIHQEMGGIEYLQSILKGGLFNIWGKLIRRSLYTENPVEIPQHISMAEDLVAMIQLAYYAKRVVPCKVPVYHYYVRNTSMSKIHKHVVGELTDRTIFAVGFVMQFLEVRADDTTRLLLAGFVNRFVYDYMRSPYPVSLRRDELKRMTSFVCDYKFRQLSFSGVMCRLANHYPCLAKKMVRLSQLIRK